MLARGLSVEDIERLLKDSPGPAPGRVSPQFTGEHSRAAYHLAGAIEAMTMADSGPKGTEEITALLEVFLQRGGEPTEMGNEPAASAVRRAEVQRLCSGLAPALESMAHQRTREEIAAFLDTFLPRGVELPETGKAPDLLLPPLGPAVRGSEIQRLGSGRDG